MALIRIKVSIYVCGDVTYLHVTAPIFFWSKLLQIALCIKDFNIRLFHNQHADNSYLLSEKSISR